MGGGLFAEEQVHWVAESLFAVRAKRGRLDAMARARLEVGPAPRGGDGSTVSATGNGDNQTSGGSLKFIADTEDWDNPIGLNTPGQSGDPESPHYRDLFEMWSKGRYFPVAYSRSKVESVTETVTRLSPTPAVASSGGRRSASER